MYAPAHGEIRLQPKQAPGYERDTVLHEILHAVIQTSGLKTGTEWTKSQEEFVVAAITPLLLDTLQRNPKLVTWLLER